MHTQIKAIIATLKWHKAGTGEVAVQLTSGQNTPMGKLLFNLYYRMDVIDLLGKRACGYPHNGGEHCLFIHAPWGDVVAFLDLFQDEVQKFKLTTEESQVAGELSFISQEIYLLRSANK